MVQRKTQISLLSAVALVSKLTGVEPPPSLPTLYIDAQQTANTQPVATYESPISNLEFEPRVDLQSRNFAEAQGDVTIRGGIFENTGFRVGSATLIDPQTGHYFAELPIAPEMLTDPTVLTGTRNALYGFNSTVGTIAYDWSRIADGGSLTLGGGDHDLNFQRLHHAQTGPLGQSGDWSWGPRPEFPAPKATAPSASAIMTLTRTTAGSSCWAQTRRLTSLPAINQNSSAGPACIRQTLKTSKQKT